MCRGWWGLLSVNMTWCKLIIDLEKRFSEISTSTFCSRYLVTKFSCHQNMEVKKCEGTPIFNTAMYEHFIHGFTHLLPHPHSPPPPPLPPTHPHSDALDALGLKRYCCRRMLLSHVDLIEKLLNYAPLEK